MSDSNDPAYQWAILAGLYNRKFFDEKTRRWKRYLTLNDIRKVLGSKRVKKK